MANYNLQNNDIRKSPGQQLLEPKRTTVSTRKEKWQFQVPFLSINIGTDVGMPYKGQTDNKTVSYSNAC